MGAAALSAPAAAAAPAPRPDPGSAVAQYVEMIPTATGARPTRPVAPAQAVVGSRAQPQPGTAAAAPPPGDGQPAPSALVPEAAAEKLRELPVAERQSLEELATSPRFGAPQEELAGPLPMPADDSGAGLGPAFAASVAEGSRPTALLVSLLMITLAAAGAAALRARRRLR